VQRGVGWLWHKLEGAIMLATLGRKSAYNRRITPWDRDGREGHFKAIIREVYGSWYLEDTLHGFEEGGREMDREVISGGRCIR